MKLNKETTPWDHFKGEYKSKPKEKEKTEIGILTFNMLEAAFHRVLNKGHSHWYDTRVYGSGWLFTSTPSHTMQITGIWEDEEAVSLPEPECIHDPIDVGFMQPKLVCKHCDKEMK